MFNTKDAMSALDLAQQVGGLLRDARAGSIIEFTRGTRVEPLTLVDMRSTQLPYIDDVLNTLLNMVCGYYLQAFHLSVNINNVDVIRLLDKLNPNRDPLDSAASSRYLSMVNIDNNIGSLNFGKAPTKVYSQEATSTKSGESHMTAHLNEQANLSVGKLIEVSVGEGDKQARIPINVRLMVNTMFSDPMVKTLSMGNHEITLKERYHSLRSGQIRFISDFILCQDLIDEHRENLIKDTSGMYRKRAKQQSKNKLAAILSGQASVASASTIIVLNEDTMREAESKGKYRINNFKSRSKFFETNHAMIIAVINPDWENVTFYFRSIEEPTVARVADIQKVNKSKGGPNILEMLTALRDVRAPSI